MTAPFRTRSLWRPALGDLARHRGATAVGLLGAVAATLLTRTAWRGAALSLHALAAGDGLASLANGPTALVYAAERAILMVASGLGAALLIGAVTRAAALSSYAGTPAWRGWTRGPTLLAIDALAMIVLVTLGVAALLLLARALPHFGSARERSVAAAGILAPLVAIGLAAAATAQVAQALVARGLPLGLALAHGCDFTLRRFPSLVRFASLAPAVTAPLWLLGALMPFPLRSLLAALAALWCNAALIRLVGADARLAGG